MNPLEFDENKPIFSAMVKADQSFVFYFSVLFKKIEENGQLKTRQKDYMKEASQVEFAGEELNPSICKMLRAINVPLYRSIVDHFHHFLSNINENADYNNASIVTKLNVKIEAFVDELPVDEGEDEEDY